MEPSLPTPPLYESAPQPESTPGIDGGVKKIESTPSPSPEQASTAIAKQAPPPVTSQSLQPPMAASQLQTSSDDAVASATTPAIADDVDVIEKEWVDKAKKIVSATKDNPHQQEKEVSKLQADYLLKRYGKQVKLAE